MSKWVKLIARHGVPVLGDYFSHLIKYQKHPEKYPIEERFNFVKRRLYKISKTLNCEIVINGAENIPEETCVLYPNHLSSADVVLFFSVLNKPTTFVAKKEISKWPIVRSYFKANSGLFIDRKDLKQSLKVMMKVQEDLIKNKDKDWVIFPEGTRNRDNLMNIKEFHHGSFRPAMKAGVPIVPVAVTGTHRVLSTKYVLKKYPIHITFLKPIMPEEYKNMDTKQVAKLVKNAVEKEVYFNLREKDIKAMKEIDKNCRPNLLK